ncbi:MAG TPA: Xaa-Pro peptidase family protein [Gemmatimonadaceae bacterium]|nr:Xaa-Pro peptidase family protein [Gemmatimonadaceae bacterium]
MLTPETLPAVQRALAEAGVDGWLLFDFRGLNPVAGGMLGVHGMLTRRIFGWVPREGVPVAITHNIEQGAWRDWPPAWTRERYSAWQELEALLARHVGGRTVAMEYSPGDAVPYLDRVPAGVLELVRAAGARVVSSGELVTRFYAVLTPSQIAAHERASRIVADTGQAAIRRAGELAAAGTPLAEHELRDWIMSRLTNAGLGTDHPAIVAVNAGAANPHYEPSPARPVPIARGDVLLVDLWGTEPEGVHADQTWMGSLGPPSERVQQVWTAVRDARDAAIALVRDRAARRAPVRGAELDDAARAVIVAAGFGQHFVHRTGHSIDARDLHGSGPHLDNYETREERLLQPGVAFSIEPGIYLPGEFGVRSEVNAVFGDGEAIITPREYQRELMVV